MRTLYPLTSCPEAHAIGAWGHTGLSFEMTGEVALIVKAGFVGNFSDLAGGVREELSGLLDSHGMEEAGWSDTKEILKATIEMGGGNSGEIGHRFHRDIFGVVLFEMTDYRSECFKTFFGFVGSFYGVAHPGDPHDIAVLIAKRDFA